jgi:SAM-dependent methyltransferase
VSAVREMRARDWDRVASDYFTEVVSPLAAGLPRPLVHALDAVPDARRKTAADLGCGIGTLLPALAARFGRVLGIDFSPAMLARARANCRAGNVALHRADLADLRAFHGRVDVAITVNAVLTPDPDRLDRVFAELAATLRPSGVLLGIFPAMEAILYQGLLIHERERRRSTPERARAKTSAILERAKYDFVHGTYREAETAQKFFYAFELEYRLRRAGFRHIRLGRVLYPWETVGGYESFPAEPPMWDWLVRATRPAASSAGLRPALRAVDASRPGRRRRRPRAARV